MLDFLLISSRPTKNGVQVYPRFRLYPKSKDLMIRGRDFYAVWDEEAGLWSTNEDECFAMIDRELDKYVREHHTRFEKEPQILYMWDSDSGMVDSFHKYCQRQMRDSYESLDENLIFSNTITSRENYASKKLDYPLQSGGIVSYNKIIGTLYSEEERHKLEWAIGSIVSGDSKSLQKFVVLYGEAGTGKSTILNIIQQLFKGYYCVFDAKALGQTNNSFALEPFKNNPLVAIQHDGDLSKIEDNTRLNSLVSHEEMTINEKFKSLYVNRYKCFLFMGTNKPVRITDSKSGLLRRLIDVVPSGKKLQKKEYESLMSQIPFELGAIASHCLEVYKADPGYYDNYVPNSMMSASNDFYNFMIDSFSVFRKEDGTTLKAAWEMYKTYRDEANIPWPLSKTLFKEELKTYFWEFDDLIENDDGMKLNSYYSGFKIEKFKDDLGDRIKKMKPEPAPKPKDNLIDFSETESIFDKEYADCPAQLASDKGTPMKRWDEVTTKLSDVDTSTVHYVKVPENHIVIDFDIKDEDGNKSFEKNIEAASKWPATYAELSKSGGGIHLHYIYTGDVSQLSRIFDDDIEVKVFNGNSSLRRRLSKCNNLPIATISSGLPLKGGKVVLNFDGLKSERALRTLIKRHLNKEIMGATKPSIDMIYKCLEESYESGLSYDVSDMKNEILAFAIGSTNQADACLKLVNKMQFKSEEAGETVSEHDELVFFDIEIFSNLFLVNWKVAGEDKPVVRMINPKASEIEELIKYKLIGFNNRRFDNHILYAALMGYTVEQLYNLSQRIINSQKGSKSNALFREAYNLSYADVYDFAAKKQSLKKWEIELGLKHHELGLPWDEPVPEERWEEVAEYCISDVLATEAVFNHLRGDWVAREILADLAGMPVNTPTNTLTTKIIFGNERKPKLVYTDLATGEQS